MEDRSKDGQNRGDLFRQERPHDFLLEAYERDLLERVLLHELHPLEPGEEAFHLAVAAVLGGVPAASSAHRGDVAVDIGDGTLVGAGGQLFLGCDLEVEGEALRVDSDGPGRLALSLEGVEVDGDEGPEGEVLLHAT
jgi:hypothetical protein